ELRSHLGTMLPDHMVPSVFVVLEALPLLPSGKVDRRALPAPEPGTDAGIGERMAPRDPLEQILAAIWSQLLGLAEVGAHDDFFALGGHSLLATQVQSRIRRELEIELPLRVLFEQPTVAGLAASVAAALRRHEGLEAPPLRALARRPGETVPLSFAQQRLWFIDRFQPDSALYNLPVLFRLAGRLDRGALGRAVDEIVRRHEVLRTHFDTVDEVPVQVIEPAAGVPLPGIDLRALAEPERRAAADQLASQEAQRPFDLGHGPVLRAVLLQLENEAHVLCLTVHHIAFDGWSMAVFLRELEALYRAFTAGRSLPLPEPEVQYADFAVWQRQWLRGEVLEAQLGYWREQLTELPVLELPCDRPRPAVQSFRGEVEEFPLPAELYRRLQELGEERGVTLFMTLLAAVQVLLGRHTGQRDFAVGTPVANRNRAETEGLIGFFVNTLVLRADLSGAASFAQLLARAREVALGAYAHQDLPFEKLVEELEPVRNLAQNPLVQVLFALNYAPPSIRELGPGLRVDPDGVATEQAKFDLTLSLSENEQGLRGAVEYSVDLFDVTTIRRFTAHLILLLQGVAGDPEKRVAELPLLAAGERQQLLREWCGSGQEIPEVATVPERFAALVERTPDAVAIVCDERRLSYRQLDERANQLAHHLQALGVGRSAEPSEIRVAVAAERSPEVVVGLLGILKAGGVYLPLDPTHPRERLAFQLRDAGAQVLLVPEAVADALPPRAEHGARVVYLDGPQVAVLDRESRVSPHRRSRVGMSCPPSVPPRGRYPDRFPDPDQLAYLIYTSGTTGVPKAVAVSHRQVLPVLSWFIGYFGVDEHTRVLQTLSPCFDFGVRELLTTLLGGGTLCFLPTDEQADPGCYLDAIERHELNTVLATPSLFRELIAGGRPLPGLEIVHLGGETLSRELVREAEAVLGRHCRVHNGYGLTEAAINNTVFRMQGRPLDRGLRAPVVPIGRATAENLVYVLDRRGRAQPLGVPGELAIGGRGVARGYLHRPALTAERFVPHPDPGPGRGGERLYRSGDRVRFLPDGNIEFLGRMDHQVKVRGFRIELEEIETALLIHEAIRECAVVVCDERLVAYVVAGDAQVRGRELSTFLRSRLPEYMVPAAFGFLDRMPLTPTGKIDRTALGRRFLPAPDREADLVAPRTPIEELVAGIWCEVLGHGAPGTAQVGVDDNFFELGGHSLLATQVISRLRTTLGVELGVRELFAAPVLGELAARIEAARKQEQGVEVPPIVPVPRDRDLPLSLSQERLWFLDRLQPGTATYNLPVLLRLRGPLQPGALMAGLNEVIRRHESLRTTFREVAGRPFQILAPFNYRQWPVVDLARLVAPGRERELERRRADEAAAPFDLARGPLLRAHFIHLAAEEWELLLNFHHIVTDGWSMQVLARELAALYQALVEAKSSPGLPELPFQYADYAVWQRQWLVGEELERQLGWWRRQLGDRPPNLDLPTDRPRPPVQTFRGASRPITLSSELSDELRQLGREHGATAFMTLLAAFRILLARLSGTWDVLVGTPIAGRTREEIEGLI
ncbi:MAG: amino acid adenylation domain-containing protein, partial [bacterium]|nr:amino acid adenylation domain-containing protein [bacterium]